MKHSIEEVVEEFGDFMEGYRVLFLIHRSKEGGTNKGTKMYKEISKNSEDFINKLTYLYERANIEQLGGKKPIPLRIYSSANNRDIKKAVRKFKENQLDADYNSVTDFYTDIKNRFISSLMSPSARKTKLFLIDVDDNKEAPIVEFFLRKNGIDILKEYKTVNGKHFITEPFNPKQLEEFELESVSIKKDGLLLLTWNHYVGN